MKRKPSLVQREDARFYEVAGRQLPSVTSVLKVFSKPGLVFWYAKMQRLSDAEIARKAKSPDEAAALIEQNTRPTEAHITKATDIGAQAHAAIEWALRKKLGLPVGAKPVLKDAALKCYEACRAWFRREGITPLGTERVLYDLDLGVAGTMDFYGQDKQGRRFLLDWKTGNRVYPEAFLQNVAYRHMAARMKMPSEYGLIVRLPKEGGEPEVIRVPQEYTFEDFVTTLNCWRLWRRMEGKTEGGEV